MIKVINCNKKNYLNNLHKLLDLRRSGERIENKTICNILKDIKNNKNKSLLKYERKFSKKVVTHVKKFKEFYVAETYHQDYYEKNFIRYLMYKKGCQREETLNKIWG